MLLKITLKLSINWKNIQREIVSQLIIYIFSRNIFRESLLFCFGDIAKIVGQFLVLQA